MLVVMQAHATEEQVRAVCAEDRVAGLPRASHSGGGAHRDRHHRQPGRGGAGHLEEMPGVAEVIRVTKPYKLVSRDVKQDNTVIRFPGTDADDRRARGWP